MSSNRNSSLRSFGSDSGSASISSSNSLLSNSLPLNHINQERHMSTITFTRIDAKGPGACGLNPALHDPADVVLEGARAPHALNAFSDATNMLSAGVWQCDAGTLKLADLPIHEVCVLIEGEVVITSDDGRSDRYAAGDAFV